jgi:hypothetical protein
MMVFDLVAAHCSKYVRIGPCFENRRNTKKSHSTTRSHLDIARDADVRSGSKAERIKIGDARQLWATSSRILAFSRPKGGGRPEFTNEVQHQLYKVLQ